jgi:hypothetical protein
VLDLLLSIDFPGVAELRLQAAHAVVEGRCDCGQCHRDTDQAGDPSHDRSVRVPSDPARLERAATLSCCGGHALTG